MKGNPLSVGNYLDEDKFVGSGYSNSPWLCSKTGGRWNLDKAIDDGVNKKKAAAVGNNAFSGEQVFFDGVKLAASCKSEPTDSKH